jgi:hypothetical protein
MTKFSYSKEQWRAIKALFGSVHLGIDAVKTTVASELDGTERPLRQVLEEVTNLYLGSTKPRTSMQKAAEQRRTLAKIEALLRRFGPESRYRAFGIAFIHDEAHNAKAALTALAERLKNQIAKLDAQGSKSKDNARKQLRNEFWIDLIDIWQMATAGAKRPPLRRHLIKFLRLCSPKQFVPSSDKTVANFLDRLKRGENN